MGDYLPGDVGAAWTEDELLAVKATLQWTLRNPKDALEEVPSSFVRFHKNDEKSSYTGKEIFERFHKKVDEGGINEGFFLGEAVLPDIGKVIRLAFHDCIKDEETGGCNGCLNFEGMGTENAGVKQQGCQIENVEEQRSETCARDFLPKTTDNNNLLWVSQVLEKVYTARNLPIPPFNKKSTKKGKTKFTQGSLKETGKSRADLWAYAGLVAIELAAQYHNNQCKSCTSSDCSSKTDTFCAGQVDENDPSCLYTMPAITFKYGRRDCVQKCTGGDDAYGFCSPAYEKHPNPHGNGKSVTEFLADDFGLTGRESIALLGAHTFGHANEQISGFRHYPWVDEGQDRLNNEYYKGVVEKGMYRREKVKSQQTKQKCNMDYSSFVGDEYGNPWHVEWVVRSQWQNEDGGPWNWNPLLRKCDERICDSVGEANWVMYKIIAILIIS